MMVVMVVMLVIVVMMLMVWPVNIPEKTRLWQRFADCAVHLQPGHHHDNRVTCADVQLCTFAWCWWWWRSRWNLSPGARVCGWGDITGPEGIAEIYLPLISKKKIKFCCWLKDQRALRGAYLCLRHILLFHQTTSVSRNFHYFLQTKSQRHMVVTKSIHVVGYG